MINYRVENIVMLVDELKKDNVTLIDEIAEYENGELVHRRIKPLALNY